MTTAERAGQTDAAAADRRKPGAVVIGIGNRDRGDDGVGPLVIDRLRQRASTPDRQSQPAPGDAGRAATVELVAVDGDLCDLALRWRADQTVVLVDAVRSGRKPGTIVTVDGLRTPLQSGGGTLSSHGIGLAEAIELARLLNRLPRSLTIFGVEAASLGHGSPVSGPVVAAADEVVKRIEVLIGIRSPSTGDLA